MLAQALRLVRHAVPQSLDDKSMPRQQELRPRLHSNLLLGRSIDVHCTSLDTLASHMIIKTRIQMGLEWHCVCCNDAFAIAIKLHQVTHGVGQRLLHDGYLQRSVYLTTSCLITKLSGQINHQV